MKSKILVFAAAMTMLAGGAAHAQSYDGTPPYASGGYGYAGYNGGGDCEGFTIAGAHAGVTVLGISVGAGGRARIGGDCRGGGQAAYAPPPVYQGGGYQGAGYGYQQQGYPEQGGAYYGQSQVQYVQPVYAQPQYAPAYAAPAAYGYAQPVYAQPAPCGCGGQAYGYAPGY